MLVQGRCPYCGIGVASLSGKPGTVDWCCDMCPLKFKLAYFGSYSANQIRRHPSADRWDGYAGATFMSTL